MSVVSKWKLVFFLSFVFGFVVRLIPEVLLSPYPIGFDAFFYAWRIRSGVVWYHWSQVFSTWLLYAILIPLYNVTRIDLFILVKLTAVSLFGFSACGIFYFATKALDWTIKKGLLGSAFFSLQAAALAFSSNFYRAMFGFGILLFTLPLIKGDLRSTRRFLAFMLLSVLVVFSHELVSVVFLFVFLVHLVSRFVRRLEVNTFRRLLAVLPALTLFLISFYFFVFPLTYGIEKNVLSVNEPAGNYQGSLFFFENYLTGHGTAQYGSVYLDFVSQNLFLFAFFYIVALPLVLVGFFRDTVLDGWTALLLIGTFGALVIPFFALAQWWRWMLMLAYPLSFYAANGITKLLRASGKTMGSALKRVKWVKLSHVVVKLILILPFLPGLVFGATFMQGTAIPLSDVDDTVKALEWLDGEMDDDSALLLHVVFVFLARFYVDEKYTRISFEDDIEGATNVALQDGFRSIYFLWWTEDNGLHDLVVPGDFVSVFSSGRMSVFSYNGFSTGEL